MPKTSPIPFVLSFLFLAFLCIGCVGPGDPESVDSIDRAADLYERDVNGGMAPEDAQALGARLVDLYAEATKPADPGEGADPVAAAAYQADLVGWEANVDAFQADLFSLIVDRLSYDVAIDFFAAALRYELSKFPKGEAPATTRSAGSADDP